MLLYTTKFPVKEKFSVELFVELAIQWVRGSKNYSFKELHYENNILEDRDENSEFKILNFPDDKMTAVHLRHYDGKGHYWTTNFFLFDSNGHKTVSTQLHCESDSTEVNVPGTFKLPYLLKQIQELGYAGTDVNLAVQNTPFEITIDNHEQFNIFKFEIIVTVLRKLLE